MGYIIAVLNNKGGVGKTTITCNLADGLGKKHKSVLVVDLDPQCNASKMLLNTNTHIRKSIYEVLDPDESNDLSGCFYPTTCKNVSMIPNISETGGLEPDIINNAPDSFFQLRNKIRDKAIDEFDYTLIDCPPNMGSFVLCALYTSDFAIVPIKAGSVFSIEGLIKASNLISEVRKKGNPDMRFLRLLINAVDKRTSISKSVISQLHAIFNKDQVFETKIPVNTTFELAESGNKTVFQQDPSSTGARAFRSLTKEVISILEG